MLYWQGCDGSRVEATLDLCGLATNKNTIVGDTSALVPSGLRMGACHRHMHHTLHTRGCTPILPARDASAHGTHGWSLPHLHSTVVLPTHQAHPP